MNDMLDNWQRIEKIVNWTGLSVNAFAKGIGLKRAENLYQIKKGNNGISKELAEMIVAKYPNVNKSWLLTGSGEIFLDENGAAAQRTIPYYKIDAVKLALAHPAVAPEGFFALSPVIDCEMAALNLNTAMEPVIPFGAFVFLKKSTPETLLPGNDYLLVSSSFNGIRCIRREPGSPQLKLVPHNKRDYDEVIVEAAGVQALYAIQGYLVPK